MANRGRQPKPAEIEADRVVRGLIEQLLRTERALSNVQEELKQHMEMIAEIQPKLTAEGLVTLRAMKSDDDSAQEFTVTVQPVKQEPIP